LIQFDEGKLTRQIQRKERKPAKQKRTRNNAQRLCYPLVSPQNPALMLYHAVVLAEMDSKGCLKQTIGVSFLAKIFLLFLKFNGFAFLQEPTINVKPRRSAF
jgi:hypothetical protein